MAGKLTSLKVFIASPGGVADERKAFRSEIQEYNESDAIPRGVLFQPVGWEDTLGSIGRPQAIINEDVRACDYFILLLWDQWGSPPDVTPSRFSSGTEEEYDVALKSHSDLKSPMRKLVMMFKAVDPKQLSDPGTQLQKVLEFRKTIENEKTHLFQTFDNIENFRTLLRRHLAAWLRDEEAGGTAHKHDEPVVGPDAMKDLFGVPPNESSKPLDKPLTATAWALANKGRITEAEVEFAKLTVGRSQPEPLIEYGQFLARLGRLDQAQVLIECAITIATDQKDQQALATAYGNLGVILKARGNLDRAEAMQRKALEINEKLARLDGMADNYGNLGTLLRARGDLDGAEAMIRKSLETNEKLARLDGMASNYGELANVLQIRGDLGSTEAMLRKSLEINLKLGHLEGMASGYGNLGILLQTRKNPGRAEEMYRKAIEINEKLARPEGLAANYGNLGILLKERGDLDGAEAMQRKALEINEKLARPEGLATNYGNLGILLKARGDLDGAEAMQRKALEINEKLARLDGLADNYGNLGTLLKARGDLGGAEAMFRKSLEAAERLGSPRLITKASSAITDLRNQPSGLGKRNVISSKKKK